MSNTDWLLPVFYAVLGALVLLALQQAWQHLRRRPSARSRPGPLGTRENASSAPTVETSRARVVPEAYWLWQNLTAREKEIARLVARGKRNAEIAGELWISPHTVETHLKHVYFKLQLSSRTELVNLIRDLDDWLPHDTG